jgi:ATP-binding cassette subfamily B protein/subfamily B ATP-binding cassette protein MsbA
MVCSLGVAILWGANIGAMYPFLEVTLAGKSLHEANAERTLAAEVRQNEHTKAIEEVQAQLAQTTGEEQRQLTHKLAELESQLEIERQTLSYLDWARGWLEAYVPPDPFESLLFVVGIGFLATLVKCVLLVISVALVARAIQNAIFELQGDFFRRTLRLDLATFQSDRASGLMSRFTHDVRVLAGSLEGLFGQAIREPLKMIACLVGAAMISWQLLVFSLLIAPLGILFMRTMLSALKRTTRKEMDVISELYNRLSESFYGIMTVKAFGMETAERRRYRQSTHRLRRLSRRVSIYLALTKPAAELAGIAVVSVALLAGAYLLLNQQTHLLGIPFTSRPFTPAGLLLFYGFLVGTADPARKMSGIYGQVFAGLVAAERIFSYLDREPAVASPRQPKRLPSGALSVEFEGVTFAYPERDPSVRDINLAIQPGETIAIVGHNGCGKSTLVKLVGRLFDPSDGTIRVGGIDIRDASLKQLRKRIGYVTQEAWLFDDTILENIRYGRSTATDEEVIAAAERAQAHEFITGDLPHGYETQVGQQGGQLSGGQRQRIALARAILRDPDVLILDEATSQIDSASERDIQQVLAEFGRDRTVIIVSHRGPMLDLADRVIVMEEGRLVDAGSADELILRSPFFQHMDPTRSKAA